MKNTNYETEFENLQNMIALLVKTDTFSSNYYEDDKYFYIRNNNKTAHSVRKRRYRYKMEAAQKLLHDLQGLNKTIQSMQRLYLASRSNAFERPLKALFDERNTKHDEFLALRRSIVDYSHILFDIVSEEHTDEPLAPYHETVRSTSKSPTESAKRRKHRIKKYLFETYEQCISQKTSSPTYMTKENIIKHIKEHDPHLLAMLPKNIRALKKEEAHVRSLTEYLTVFAKPPVFTFTTDEPGGTVFVKNVNELFKSTQWMGNTRIRFEMFHNGVRKVHIVDDENVGHDVFNFMNFRFSVDNHPLNVSNHSQHLHLHDCHFEDRFDVAFASEPLAHIAIHRYPLHTFKACVLQKISLRSLRDSVVRIDLDNLLNMVAEGEYSHHQNHLFSQSSDMVNYYTVADKSTSIMTTFEFDPNTVATFVGSLVDHVDGTVRYRFNLAVSPAFDTVVYVLSSVTRNKNPRDKRIDVNTSILRSVRVDEESYETIIQTNGDLWRSSIWNLDLRIHPKTSIASDNLALLKAFNANNQVCLFNLLSDPFNGSVDLDVYGLPMLILTKPELAMDAVRRRCQHFDFENRLVAYDDYANDAYDVVFDKKSASYFCTKVALLCIHHWNVFRTTRNLNWLLNETLPFYHKSLPHLLAHDYLSTDDTVVNYLVEQAAYFVQQAYYEANYPVTVALPTYVVPSFDDRSVVAPSGNVVIIRLQTRDHLLTACFYNSDDSALGYRFGGSSGFKIGLSPNTTYTFHFDFDLKKYPFRFHVMNDELGARFTIHGVAYDNIDQYDSFIDPDTNVFEINSDMLLGYSFVIKQDVHSQLLLNLNTRFGKLAFDNRHFYTLTNIIKPTSDYNFDTLDKVGTYLCMNSYYNATFFRGQPKAGLFESKKAFADRIQDNIVFYNKHYSYADPLTNLLEAGLECVVAQFSDTYKIKHNLMTTFYTNLVQTVRDNTLNEKNWLRGDLSGELLFMFLTHVLELTPSGEVRKDRLKVSEYELMYNDKNTLPLFWKTISMENVGSASLSINLTNMLYFDHPFLNFPHLTTYAVHNDAILQRLSVSLDFREAFPNGVPESFHFYFYLQEQSDTNDYALEDSERPHKLQTLYEKVLAANTVLDEDTITLSYEPVMEIAATPHTTTTPLLSHLENRVALFIYNLVTSDEASVPPVFELIAFNLRNVLSASVIQGAPKITCAIDYEKPLTLTVTPVYDSVYKPFSSVSLRLEHDPLYFVGSGARHDATDVAYASEISYDDSVFGRLSTSITTETPLTTSSYALGTFRYTIDYKAALANYTNDVHRSLRVSSDTADTRVSNPEVFPPHVTEIRLAEEFLDTFCVITHLYTSDELNAVFRYPIIEVRSRAAASDSTLAYINDVLNTQNKSLVNVLGTPESTIFVLKPNAGLASEVLEYYGVGRNEHNVLMTNDPNTERPYLETPERCGLLENGIDGYAITDVYLTTRFALVKAANGKMYGIGNNDAFNLGDGTNISSTRFVESTLLNALSEDFGGIKHIVVNDTCVLVQFFTNNMVYAFGKMDALIDAQIPTPFAIVNTFLQQRGHVIVKIQAGRNHFKFLLKRDGVLEWWGIGRNSFCNMGVDRRVDNELFIGRMQRLHELERMIHGKKYDPEYRGLSVNNSQKYHFVSTHGMPAACTLVIDETNNAVFMLGTFDETDESATCSAWTRVEDIELGYGDKFFACYKSDFVTGYVNFASLQNAMYLEIPNQQVLNMFYNKSLFKIILRVDATNSACYTTSSTLPPNTAKTIYKNELGNRDRITYVTRVYDLAQNVKAPHAAKYVGRALISTSDPDHLNYDDDNDETLTATPLLLSTLNGHKAFEGYVQFGNKFMKQEWADDPAAAIPADPYLGDYDAGDVMRYRPDVPDEQHNDFTVVLVFSMRNVGKYDSYIPIYAYMPEGIGLMLYLDGRNRQWHGAIGNTWVEPWVAEYLPDVSSTDTLLFMQRIKYYNATDGMRVNLRFVNMRTRAVIADKEITVAPTTESNIMRDWKGGPLYLGTNEWSRQNNSYIYDGTEFKVGEFILYNTCLTDENAQQLEAALLTKWNNPYYVDKRKEQHVATTLDEFYDTGRFDLMLRVDAQNDAEGFVLSEDRIHVAHIVDLSKNVIAPHTTSAVENVTMRTLNAKRAFAAGGARFGVAWDASRRLPLYEDGDVMSKNNHHDYTVATVAQFDDYGPDAWAPIVSFFHNRQGIYLGRNASDPSVTIAFGDKTDPALKISSDVRGRPVLYVQRFKNQDASDQSFDYSFRAIDLRTNEVLIDATVRVTDPAQNMLNNFGGSVTIGAGSWVGLTVGELLFMNECLTDANTDTLVGLLAAKWGVPTLQNFYDETTLPTLMRVDAQDLQSYTATIHFPSDTSRTVYKNELGNRPDVTYVSALYDMSRNTIAPHKATYIGRALISTTDPNDANHDDGASNERITTTPMLLSKMNGRNAFEGFAQFGRKFFLDGPDVAPFSYNGFYADGDVMKHNYHNQNVNDFTVAMVFSIKNWSKTAGTPFYSWMPSWSGMHFSQWSDTDSLSQRIGDLSKQLLVSLTDDENSGAPILMIQRTTHSHETATTTMRIKFVNIKTQTTLLDETHDFVIDETVENHLSWLGGPLYLGIDEYAMLDRTYDGSEFKVGEFIMYNERIDDYYASTLEAHLVSKWSNEGYQEEDEDADQFVGTTLADFYDPAKYATMLRIDALNTDGYAMDETHTHVASVRDLSKNVKAPHTAVLLGGADGGMTLGTINLKPAFQGFVRFGIPRVEKAAGSGYDVPLYEDYNVMSKNNYHNYTLVTVAEYDDFGAEGWSPIASFYSSVDRKGLYLGQHGTNSSLTSAFGGKTDAAFDIGADVRGRPVVYVQRFKNNTARDDDFNHHFRAIDLYDGTVLVDVVQNVTGHTQDMFNDLGGCFSVGIDDGASASLLSGLRFGEVLFYNEFLHDTNVGQLVRLLADKWSAPTLLDFYNRTLFPSTLMRVDAQNVEGYTTSSTLPPNTAKTIYKNELGNRDGVTYVTRVYDLAQNVKAPHAAKYLGRALIWTSDPDWLNYDDDNDETLTATPLLLSTLNGHRAFEGYVQFGNKFIKQEWAVDPADAIPADPYLGDYDAGDVMRYRYDTPGEQRNDFTVVLVFSMRNLGKVWYIPFYSYMPEGVGLILYLDDAKNWMCYIGRKWFTLAVYQADVSTIDPLLFMQRIKYYNATDGMRVHLRFVNTRTHAVIVDKEITVELTTDSTNIMTVWKGGPLYLGTNEWSRQNDGWMYDGTELKTGEFIMYNTCLSDYYARVLEDRLTQKWGGEPVSVPEPYAQHEASGLEDFYDPTKFHTMLRVDATASGSGSAYALGVDGHVISIFDLSGNVRAPHATTLVGQRVVARSRTHLELTPMRMTTINLRPAFGGCAQFGVVWHDTTTEKRLPLYEDGDVMSLNNRHDYTIVTVAQFDDYGSGMNSPIVSFFRSKNRTGIYLGQNGNDTSIISALGNQQTTGMTADVRGKPVLYVQRFRNNTALDNDFNYYFRAIDLTNNEELVNVTRENVTGQVQVMLNNLGGHFMIGVDDVTYAEQDNLLAGFAFGEVLFYNECLTEANTDLLVALLKAKWSRPALNRFYDTSVLPIMMHIDAQDERSYDSSTEMPANTNNVDYLNEFGNRNGVTYVTNIYDLSRNVVAPHAATFIGRAYQSATDTNQNNDDDLEEDGTLKGISTTPMILTKINGYNAFEGFIQFGRKFFHPVAADYIGHYEHGDVRKRNTDNMFTVVLVLSQRKAVKSERQSWFLWTNWDTGLHIHENEATGNFVINVLRDNYDIPIVSDFTSQYSQDAVLSITRAHYDTSNNNTLKVKSVLVNINTNAEIGSYENTRPNYTSGFQNPNVFGQLESGPLYLGLDNYMYHPTYYPYDGGEFKVGECIMYNTWLSDNYTDVLKEELVAKWRNEGYQEPIREQTTANTLQQFYSPTLFEIMLHVDAQNATGYAVNEEGEIASVYDVSHNVIAPHSAVRVGGDYADATSAMTFGAINYQPAFKGFAQFGTAWEHGKLPLFDTGHVMHKNNRHNYTLLIVARMDDYEITTPTPLVNFYKGKDGVGLYYESSASDPYVRSYLAGQRLDNGAPSVLGKPVLYMQRIRNNSSLDGSFDVSFRAIDLATNTLLVNTHRTDVSVPTALRGMFMEVGGHVMIGADHSTVAGVADNQPAGFAFGEVLLYNECLNDANADRLFEQLRLKWQPPGDILRTYFYNKNVFDIMVHVDAQNANGYEMIDSSVRYVFDLSQNVKAPHRAVSIGKSVTQTVPVFSTSPMTLTTLNGHTALDGFVQFGAPNTSEYPQPYGNYDNFDVMKKNTSESFSIFTVCSISGTNAGGWASMVNYYRANGNRGLSITQISTTGSVGMYGATKPSPNDALKSPNLLPDYADTPLLFVQRYENLTGGTTNDRFNYHLRVIAPNTNAVVVDVTQSITAPVMNVFNAYGGHFMLGTDELMYTYGDNNRFSGFKVGESIMYNNFLSDADTDKLCALLIDKWK